VPSPRYGPFSFTQQIIARGCFLALTEDAGQRLAVVPQHRAQLACQHRQRRILHRSPRGRASNRSRSPNCGHFAASQRHPLRAPRRHDHRRPRREIRRRIQPPFVTVAPDRRARAIPQRTSTSQIPQKLDPLTPLPTSTFHVPYNRREAEMRSPSKAVLSTPSKSVILLTFLPPSQPSSGLLSPFSSRIPGLLSTICCAVNRSFVANSNSFHWEGLTPSQHRSCI
jgi:hypothetical protein